MRYLSRPALLHALLLVVCTLLVPLLAYDPPQASEGFARRMAKRMSAFVDRSTVAHVGQVIIVGNEKTPDELIRRAVAVYPGQILSYSALRQAEANLAELGLFVVDSELGIRPTVTVVDDPANPSIYKDILISVTER